MEDEPSTSYIISTSQLAVDDNSDDSNSSAQAENKSDIMPILTEVVSDISQLTNSSEEEKIVAFKTEPSSCTEMGSLEMDHFETAGEVEMAAVSMLKAEEVGTEGGASDDGVAESVQHIAAQQFIILTRASDGSSGKFSNCCCKMSMRM